MRWGAKIRRWQSPVEITHFGGELVPGRMSAGFAALAEVPHGWFGVGSPPCSASGQGSSATITALTLQ